MGFHGRIRAELLRLWSYAYEGQPYAYEGTAWSRGRQAFCLDAYDTRRGNRAVRVWASHTRMSGEDEGFNVNQPLLVRVREAVYAYDTRM